MSRLFPSLEATRLAVLLLPRLALTPRVLPPLLVALMPVEAVHLTLLLLTLPPMLVLVLPQAELLLPAAVLRPVALPKAASVVLEASVARAVWADLVVLVATVALITALLVALEASLEAAALAVSSEAARTALPSKFRAWVATLALTPRKLPAQVATTLVQKPRKPPRFPLAATRLRSPRFLLVARPRLTLARLLLRFLRCPLVATRLMLARLPPRLPTLATRVVLMPVLRPVPTLELKLAPRLV